ncbi:MAG: recombinase family protein [Myxococcota bacterium]
MPKFASAYLRCSDPRQDKSIEQQRAEIQRRADADGYVIPPENWFVDEGISGKSTKKRASYQAMIKRAEAQRDARRGRKVVRVEPIERLYVWAFSRIARNMFDCLKAIATLDDADIEIISLTENDTGDRSMRKLIRPILAWLAERYIEELSRNVRRGQISQASKGFWPHGRTSFGYESVKVQGGFKLVVSEETRQDFETVKRIFKLADELGEGCARIAKRLTREGVRPPTSNSHNRVIKPGTWATRHVHYILTNRLYCGHIVEEGEVMYRDAHEAAVDDETFERVCAKRSLRYQARRDKALENPDTKVSFGMRGLFAPWLRCGKCGGQLGVVAGGKVGGRTYLYYCRTRATSAGLCTGFSVRTEVLDARILDAIQTRLMTPENVRQIATDTVAALAATDGDAAAEERERLTASVAEFDRKIRLAATQVINGVIAEEDAKAVTVPLMEQREVAKLRLAALPSANAGRAFVNMNPEKFRAKVMEAWTNRPIEERREALRGVLDKVVLNDGGMEIHYGMRAYCEDGWQGPFNRR